MKKVFIIIFLFFTSLPSFSEHIPAYTNSVFDWGIGAINLNGKVKIYSLDDPEKIIAVFDTENTKCKIKETEPCNFQESFIAYKTSSKIAFLSVVEDNDTYYKVCFNQRKRLYGMVKKEENIDFYNWQQIINFYGRKNGLYLLRNVEDKYKKLYSSPNEAKKVVDSFGFAKHISLWLVKDNYILIKVHTYNNETKTGWLKWRLDNGELLVFPDFK